MRQPIPDRAQAWWNRGLQFGACILDAAFHPRSDFQGRFVSTAWLAALFLAGAFVWGFFFSWGNISFDFLDWGEVNGPRYALLRDAAVRGELPLHVSNTTGLRGVTDRYLAIADTPFSPQFFLMRFIDDLGTFIFLDTLFLYAVGFLGLLLIYRKYRLSAASFTVLFLIFNFNGHLISHLAVGHANWVGYFFLPYFVLAVLSVLEGNWNWKWVLGLALTLLFILLQGHFHLYVWCLLFLGALGLTYPRVLKPVIIAGLFIGLLAAFRILPPAVDLAQMDPENLNGFPSVTDMAAGLLVIPDPNDSLEARSLLNALAGWELDTFVGLIGFSFIVLFGIAAPLRKKWDGLDNFDKLLAPCLALAVLSIGQLYHFLVKVVPIPLFAGERVTSRFLIVPVVVLLIVGVIAFQRFLDQRRMKPLEQIILLVVAALLGHDLLQHMRMWRIRYLDTLTDVFPKFPVDLSLHQVANHPDPLYTSLIVVGAVISAAALAFLIFMSLRREMGSKS